MATTYPNSIDDASSLPVIVDGVTTLTAAVFNGPRDAVVAIESELGQNPSGTYSTVRDRLDVLETQSAGGGSIVVREDSVAVGTVTALNFTGSVTATLNGTTADIAVTGGSGGGTLAQTLAAGNTTDGYDIVIKGTGSIITSDGLDLTIIPGSYHDLELATQNDTSVNGSSGEITIETGSSIGGTAGSGDVTIKTGTTAGSSNSGNILIENGNANGTGNPGWAIVSSGFYTAGSDGGAVRLDYDGADLKAKTVDIYSTATGGQLSLRTIHNTTVATNPIKIYTGATTTAATGLIDIYTGGNTGTAASGNIIVHTGANSGSAADGYIALSVGGGYDRFSNRGGINLTNNDAQLSGEAVGLTANGKNTSNGIMLYCSGSSVATDSSAGAVTLQAGNLLGNTVGGNCGRVALYGGSANTGNGNGGEVDITGGYVYNGAGGPVQILAGGKAYGAIGGHGGFINIRGGDGYTYGGNVNIYGGSSDHDTGGAVYITAGAGYNGNYSGSFLVQAGTGVIEIAPSSNLNTFRSPVEPGTTHVAPSMALNGNLAGGDGIILSLFQDDDDAPTLFTGMSVVANSDRIIRFNNDYIDGYRPVRLHSNELSQVSSIVGDFNAGVGQGIFLRTRAAGSATGDITMMTGIGDTLDPSGQGGAFNFIGNDANNAGSFVVNLGDSTGSGGPSFSINIGDGTTYGGNAIFTLGNAIGDAPGGTGSGGVFVVQCGDSVGTADGGNCIITCGDGYSYDGEGPAGGGLIVNCGSDTGIGEFGTGGGATFNLGDGYLGGGKFTVNAPGPVSVFRVNSQDLNLETSYPILFTHSAEPPTPSAGTTYLWVDTDGGLKLKKPSGVVSTIVA